MSEPGREPYDLVILGTGSGNSFLDKRFADWRVAIVERGPYGGTCLNRGCIPSKMYVVPADRAQEASDGERFGLDTAFRGADWAAIRDRIFGRIDPRAAAGHDHRADQDNVDTYDGTARFTAAKELTIALADGGEARITGDRIVLAAGGRPVLPGIPGLDEAPEGVVHTSDTIMRLDALPERIGIVGGGYVGSEFAHVFSALGSQVVQVDSADVMLGNQDAEVSALFHQEASRRWDVRLCAGLDHLTHAASGSTLHLADGTSAEVDVVLVCVGRRPNSDQLGLAEVGYDVDDAGRVVVDEHQATSVEGVWALGDLSSHEPLKHVANQDARVVQHNLLHPDEPMVSDHRFVPNAVFTSPQIASVGLTEAQAREQGLDLAVGRREYADIAHGWALEEDDTGHFVKLLGDRATGRLVGAHLIGPQASVLVQVLTMAMSFDLPVAGLARGQYWIHPALTEVVEGALLELEDELGG